MRDITGKTALVTGVASGIGRAIALRLAAEGVNLYVVDIDEPGLADTVQQAHQAGVEVIGRRCDVGEPSQVSSVVAEILSRWGGVDILVNNAGITYYGPTVQMSADHWDRVLRVNLHSHIQFTRELLPSLLERREAHVVNVCSMFGLVGMPKLAAYSTTKFALVGFSESLRNECGRNGLGVTALCPGFVDTNLFTSAPLGTKQKEHKVPPRIFRTTPEKVARAAVKAIRRNRRMVVMTPAAWFLVSAKRFVPGVMDFVLHLGRRKRVERKMAQQKRAA
jgi:NAD(P)-dependent dehydrogenase (short-subunit alcohol dehydrogenase family)